MGFGKSSRVRYFERRGISGRMTKTSASNSADAIIPGCSVQRFGEAPFRFECLHSGEGCCLFQVLTVPISERRAGLIGTLAKFE